MIQLRYDKTALFFSYFLPIILLTGIGYPIEMAGNRSIEVHLYDQVKNSDSKALKEYLATQKLLKLIVHPEIKSDFKTDILKNKLSHFIEIKPFNEGDKTEPTVVDSTHQLAVTLYSDNSNNHKVEKLAISKMISQYFGDDSLSLVKEVYFKALTINSYIVTLLPGLIGMTLLTIGLNGFGGVLVVEQDAGLFQNIKTIDASPVSFLSGLFLSRLFISYTVAVALYVVGVSVFGLNIDVDFMLLFLVVTLGCVSFLGIGLVIAVLSKSVSAFNGIVNFVNIPFVVFSGVFFSTAAFPEWLQTVTQIIPLTHMNMAVKGILFEHISLSNIEQIAKELIVLFLWCCATLLIGVKKFKW